MLNRIRELRRKHRRPAHRLDLELSIPLAEILEDLDAGLLDFPA